MTFSKLARGIVEIAEQEGMMGTLDNIRSFASEAEVHRLRARVAELEANASSVRDDALREAADIADTSTFKHRGDAIRALLSSPPSAPPADVTRALATLLDAAQHALGELEFHNSGNLPSKTVKNLRAALALAEKQP